MKGRASGLLKQVIAGLSSMAKSKALALKSKTNAIKARLIILSLMRHKKFLMSSISEKFHSVLRHHHHSQSHPKEEYCLLEDGSDDQKNKAIVVYNDNNAHLYEALPNNPSETQLVEDESHYDKYPHLTHTLLETEDLDVGASVIDLVKNSKEEAGQEFKMEDEIDHMADLFIKKFRRQIFLQKQESFKRFQEMLQRGARV